VGFQFILGLSYGPDDTLQGVCHVREIGDAAADDENFTVPDGRDGTSKKN